MASKIDRAELETIEDLLSDFSVNDKLTPEDVYRITWSRYHILQQATLRDVFEEETFRLWKRRDVFALFPRIIHKFIYKDIFSFAGDYRKESDPRNGRIHFGPQHAHFRRPKFMGYSPGEIVAGIYDSVGFLKKGATDPLYQGIRFYQKFVSIHPFYDANGRIARMITNIYLANDGLTLSWMDFDGKGKFIKRLNRCHVKPDEENFQRLVRLLRSHLYKLSSEEEF